MPRQQATRRKIVGQCSPFVFCFWIVYVNRLQILRKDIFETNLTQESLPIRIWKRIAD